MRNKFLEEFRYLLFKIFYKKRLQGINLFEKKVYSQNGEDGIIEHVFNEIGVTTKEFAEIGIETGRECNTRNLIEKGWRGICIEGNEKESEIAREFYKRYPVKVINSFVTPQNINDFVKGDLDMLSIDIDGDDFWIWKGLKAKPRLIIIEYNSTYGNKSITQPYLGKMREEKHPEWLYSGAGLNALIKLGKEKGYKLICCDSSGINAFFLRKDLRERERESFQKDLMRKLILKMWEKEGGEPLKSSLS